MARAVSKDDSFKEALREKERGDSYRQWLRKRSETLIEAVSAQDVLRHFNVTLRGSDDQEEQIRCPFHGTDNKPSARVYPAGSSRSGVYCWVCQKRWDIFGLWREFNGDSEMKFGQAIKGLEKAFGIIPPEAPAFNEYVEDEGPSEEEQEVKQILAICESRLRQARPVMEMKPYLLVGKLLDLLHWEFHQKDRDLESIKARAHQVLDKIGEKIRGV